MPVIEAVVFDCDGVLVDSEPISIRRECAALNALGWAISYEECLVRFLGLSQTTADAIIERELGRKLPDGFGDRLQAEIVAAFETELAAIPHVAQAIEAVALPRCVASSSRPPRIRRALELTGLLGYFEPHVYSSTMVERGKPFPDLFLFAAGRLGVAPERCVVIEDSEAGVRAARAAGMTALGFIGGGHAILPDHGSRLAAAGALSVFDDMRGLPRLLDDLQRDR